MSDRISFGTPPASLLDLEYAPYHLQAYPDDFDAQDRAESFEQLLLVLEEAKEPSQLDLLLDDDDSDDEESGAPTKVQQDVASDWMMQRERIQALYTLVRKSTSLAPVQRQRLVQAVCDAVHCLVDKLAQQGGAASNGGESQGDLNTTTTRTTTVSSAFREAWACHVYMLYSLAFMLEKLSQEDDPATRPTNNTDDDVSEPALRSQCLECLHQATAAMLVDYDTRLWVRPDAVDNAVVLLPCNLALLTLEHPSSGSGATATATSHKRPNHTTSSRRNASNRTDTALDILAMSLDAATRASLSGGTVTTSVATAAAAVPESSPSKDGSGDDEEEEQEEGEDGSSDKAQPQYQSSSTTTSEWPLWTTVTAALMDMLHNQPHMAALTAQLCTRTQMNRLTVELLRDVGRLNPNTSESGGGGDTTTTTKASGLKLVAPFLSELAMLQPRVVLQHFSHVLPHLDSDLYTMRSAMVAAMTHLLVHLGSNGEDSQGSDSSEQQQDERPTAATARAHSQAALLDLLLERCHDSSSFTRSAVLKGLSTLAKTGSLPKDRFVATTELVIGRLQDKTVLVRRQALQLLTVLLEHNPYMGSLDPQPYRTKLAELYQYVQNNLPDNIREAHETARQEAQEQEDLDEEERAVALQELEQAALAAAISEAAIMLQRQHDADDLSESEQVFCNKVQALQFGQSALDWIELLDEATVALEGMLLSANTSDATEALRFLARARHFELPCAITGMKRALSLMWSSEASIRDQVVKTFVDVFMAEPNSGNEDVQLLPESQIAKNLLVLTGHASVSELASIEEAIMRLVKEERIPPNVFLYLWSIASKGPADARAAALQLLAMGAGADRSIVDSKSRLKLLLDAGLGEYTREHKDWRLAAASAHALQRVERAKVDPTDAKYLVLEQIMEELCIIARGEWCDDNDIKDTVNWFSAAEQAVKALFVICPEPELASRNILVGMYGDLFRGEASSCHALRLARFFHVLGQIALGLLVYTESLVGSVRRANAKKSLQKQEEADKALANKNASADSDSSGDDAIEAELGIAAEAEAENERKLAEISEEEILGRGLINMFMPLLVRVVGNDDGQFSSEILKQASVLALCRCMCVSSSFCENHLSLLFRAVSNAPEDDTTICANTVIALGDLAFRFPNEVEPYTPRLYACLRDSSTKVRRHTLMVLTHLILNDMIKVKGQVCEIALCLRDDDHRIRDMSRLLFHELSKRSNNPVYNLLPDIISQLSQLSISKEDFRSIMSFLIGYIKKDKQAEMLAEKFCQRFQKCTTVSQKADLAYCLAQLKMNERAIKYLSDNFKCYQDCLFDEDIKRSFATIVTKAKKFTKPEMRQFLEEWETKLNATAVLGSENQTADEKAERAKARASRRAARKKTRSSKRTVPVEEDDDEEEEDEFEFDGDDENETSVDKENAPRSTRGRRAVVT